MCKNNLYLITFIIVITGIMGGCHPDAIVNTKTFPIFDGITVTDEMDFFYNINQFQMICVDVSEDKIVKIYDVGYRKTMIYNFIYVKSQKKAYFMFWGDEDILMEFDPATGKSRRIGTQSYCNGGAVYLKDLDQYGLMIQDNYGHIEDGFKGAMYRYEYNTDTVIEKEYMDLIGNTFTINKSSSDRYILTSNTCQLDKNAPLYLYNFTKSQSTEINILEYIPDNPSGIAYILPNNLLAVVDAQKSPVATYLYQIESFIPFNVKKEYYDSFKTYWFNTAYFYNDILYLIDWPTKIVKYDLKNKQILDSLDSHYTEKELYGDIRIGHFHGEGVYTINSYEKDTILKINLDDFSITRLK